MDIKLKYNFKMPKIDFPKIDLEKYFPKKIKMPELRIGNLIAKVPIIQGGMGVRISLSGLASAVANEGGIGIIAANAIGMAEPDYYQNGKEANIRALRNEIRRAKQLTKGAIGVNIMVAANDFYDLLDVSIEENADLVFLGAGLPIKGIPIEKIKSSNIKIVPIVSSSRAASLIFRFWDKKFNRLPDAVVVEGPKAGGHLGFSEEQLFDPKYRLEKIVPEVVAAISEYEKKRSRSIPVIAAGGIFTGRDIFKFIKLGAKGVQMGTRFVATEECEVAQEFKEMYVKSKKEDITIIKSPVGMPGRALSNDFIKRAHSGVKQKFKCAWRCLEHCKAGKANYCISEALNNARMGIMENGYAFAGSNVFRVKKIISVKSLITELKQSYSGYLNKTAESVRSEFEKNLEKLSSLRDEYILTAEKGIKTLMLEMEEIIDKGTENFREEYNKLTVKIDNLKKEYADHLNKFENLKKQFSAFFDFPSINLPKLSSFKW